MDILCLPIWCILHYKLNNKLFVSTTDYDVFHTALPEVWCKLFTFKSFAFTFQMQWVGRNDSASFASMSCQIRLWYCRWNEVRTTKALAWTKLSTLKVFITPKKVVSIFQLTIDIYQFISCWGWYPTDRRKLNTFLLCCGKDVTITTSG